MNAPHASTNFDQAELDKFAALANRWWDADGPQKPLHALNPVRLKYVADRVTLRGARVLDIGCGGGLLSEALAQAGADVAVAGIAPPTDTIAKITALGRRCLAVEANLISIEPVERVIRETIEGLGGLDILVNNAGLIRRADAVDFSEQDWDDVMNVNIKSAFFISQAAGRHFIAQGRGKIINIASMLSFQGGIRVPSYTASKSGIAGITRLLANEWANKGINVNAIAPGYMATDNTAALRADQDRNKSILDRIPAGRWGTPEDLAGTAVFLASSASDYVNGSVIPVDGGWLAR